MVLIQLHHAPYIFNRLIITPSKLDVLRVRLSVCAQTTSPTVCDQGARTAGSEHRVQNSDAVKWGFIH